MAEPLACALVGIGSRARKLYMPVMPAVAPWLRVAAVCSPSPLHAREAAEHFAVPAFTSVEALIAAGIVEAAIVLTPIESHHAVSLALSRARIHHLVETTMASLVAQAHDMVEVAHGAGVTLGVAENYFRFPFDRLAKEVVRSGAIGEVRRLTCYHDQMGFHGHARWIKFFDACPAAVQAMSHTMPAARHAESARRIHDSETFRACFLHFPGDRLAIDMGGNLKGMLGRMPRPGYTEIDGARGAIARMAEGAFGGRAELRICSDAALAGGGIADFAAPFVDHIEDGCWASSSVALPDGTSLAWRNPHRPGAIAGPRIREWDAAVIMEILVQFAEEVRGGAPSEFSAADAVAATEIEAATRESAQLGGALVPLPLAGRDLETEGRHRAALRGQFGVDPLDADGMLAVHFPPAA
jgi:hypothetical protein